MKLNWRSYVFLMVIVCGYFLLTKPVDKTLIVVLVVCGVILAIPSYFGSRKEAKEAKEAAEVEERLAIRARKASASAATSPKQPIPGTAKQAAAAAVNKVRSPAQEALLRTIAAKRAEDPLIGAKLGAKEVVNWLITAMKSEKGVHIESLLAVLGSLAGYSCQASVREQANRDGVKAAFVVAQGADGKQYFFGDALNKPLAEDKHCVWGLAAYIAQQNGCNPLPEVGEIFKHVAATVGGTTFGIPRIPPGHSPGDLPVNFVKALWPKALPILEEYCAAPSEWPILLGLSIQDAMQKGKTVIDARLALEIVMECAIPMSKVDLADATK